VTITELEAELRARHELPYQWGQRQNNTFDQRTRFVYEERTWRGLHARLAAYAHEPDYPTLLNYAANRWYNHWSARAVEYFFNESSRVVPADNKRDRLRDFTLDGIAFDHKTSVWPRQYTGSLAQAQADPIGLVQWLYANQSREGRFHTENRLFLILHASDGAHWRLKADLLRLRAAIRAFLEQPALLTVPIETQNGRRVVTSAVIWVQG
jgi:hypothetical protein